MAPENGLLRAFMRALSATLLLMPGLIGVAATTNPVKVFVPAGQSNMEARAAVDVDGSDYNQREGTLVQLIRDAALAPASTLSYSTRSIEGWTVHVRDALLAKEPQATATALRLLQNQLAEIVREVPAPVLAKLREVPLWFSPEYPGVTPRAEYHPDARWLRENGRNPAMAKSVEFTDVGNFEKEMNRMPNFALHELAHAYHDRVLVGGFDNAEIKAAFERAKAGGTYDKVERWLGNGRPNTFERAYAMTSPQEYFAECTEALFSRNDFYPFTRRELEKHDPQMFALLQRLWASPFPDRTAPPK